MAIKHGLGTYGNAVGTVTPEDHKLAQAGLVVKDTAGKIRPGLFWEGNETIVTGKANMSYDVARFTAALSRGASSGAVLLANDGVVNVVTTAAPGSNSRYDVVYVWQREFSLDGTDSNPVIGVVQGTAAASPTVPSLSAFPGAVELARILVPAGVTATNSGTTITQTAPFTAAAGGVVPFRTKVAMDLVTDLPNGTFGVVLADLTRWTFNGSAWAAQTLTDSGWQTPTLASGWAGPGGNVVPVQYRKIGNRVTFRGGATGASAADPLFTLPADYRPGLVSGKEVYVAVMSGTGSPPSMARVVIRQNGTINVQGGTTPNFDTISYLTD